MSHSRARTAAPKEGVLGGKQPRNIFIALLSCTLGCQSPAQHHLPPPKLFIITQGAALSGSQHQATPGSITGRGVLDSSSVSWQKNPGSSRAAPRQGDAKLSPIPVAPASPRDTQAILSPALAQSGTWDPFPRGPSHDALLSRTIAIARARTPWTQGTFEHHPKCSGEICPRLISPGDKRRDSKHQPLMLSHDPSLCHRALGPSARRQERLFLKAPPLKPPPGRVSQARGAFTLLTVAVGSRASVSPPRPKLQSLPSPESCGILPGYKQGKILGKQTPWQSRERCK